MTNYVGIYETLCMLQGSVKYTSLETGQTNWKIGNLELATTPTGQVICLVNFNIGPSKKFVVTNQIRGVLFNRTAPRCIINLANGSNINWTNKINGKVAHVNRPEEIARFAAILNDLKDERRRGKKINKAAQQNVRSPQPQAYTPLKESPGLRNSQVNHQVKTTPRSRAPPIVPRTSTPFTPEKPTTPKPPTGRISPNPMMTPSHVKAVLGLVKSVKSEPKPNRGYEKKEEGTGSSEDSSDLSGLLFTDVQGDADKENTAEQNNRVPKVGSASRSKSALQMRSEEGGSLFMASFLEKQLELEERKENTAPKPVSGVQGFYSRGRLAAGYNATDALLQPRQTNVNTTAAVKRTLGFLGLPRPKKPCLGNTYEGWSQRNVPTANKTSQLSLQGFSNLGNTCYMNAILQSLFSLDRFTMDILNGSLLPHMQRDNLYKALASLLFAKQRNQSPDKVGTLLRRVKQAISSTANRFSGFLQHDAQEFLCQCLDQLKDDWEKAKRRLQGNPLGDDPGTGGKKASDDLHPCPVIENFEFEVMHSIVCKQCGEVVTKAEHFYDLSLDMPKRSLSNPIGSIQTALEQFFRAEVIEYACSECNCKQATVAHTFTRLPRVIIIHLKRYRFDADAVQNSKLRRRIVIPKYLCLHYHRTKAAQGSPSQVKSFINGAPSPRRPPSADRALRTVTGLTDGNATSASQSRKPSRLNFALSSRKRLEYSGSGMGKQPGQTVHSDGLPDSDSDETQRALEMSKREAEKAELEMEKRRRQEDEELKKAMEQSKQVTARPISEMSEEQQLAYALAISAQDDPLRVPQATPSLAVDIPDAPPHARNASEGIDRKEFASLKRRGDVDAVQSALGIPGAAGDHADVNLRENGTPCKRFKGEGQASNHSTPSERALRAGDDGADLAGDGKQREGNRTKAHHWRTVKKAITHLFSPVKRTPTKTGSGSDTDPAATPISAVETTLVDPAIVDITREEDRSTLHAGVNGDSQPSYAELRAREDEELRRATELSLRDAQEIAKKDEDALKQAKQMSLQEFSDSFTCPDDDEDTTEPMEIDDDSDDDVTTELTRNAETGHLPSSYRLTSIVSHIGSSSSVGHYISDVYSSKKTAWLSYDDSQVVHITESEVREERERTGYIFFYVAK